MKKTLLIIAMALGASIYGFAQPQLFLHGMKSFNVCPPELTSSNTPMPQIVSDGSATIYNSNFSVMKTITYHETAPYVSGEYYEKATVKPTGAKVNNISIGSQLYTYDMSGMHYLTATTAEELVEQMKVYDGSYSPYKYTSFTDSQGNIACYRADSTMSDTYNFFNYSTFGTKYPTSYYVIKDGYIYSVYASYTITYDTSYAEWTAVDTLGAPSVISTQTLSPDSYKFYDYDSNSYPDKNFKFTQALFNEDANWEYAVTMYDTNPIKHYNTYENSTTTNNDGTITLLRSVYLTYPVIGTQIKNENGAVLFTLSPTDLSNTASKYLISYNIDDIIKMNGKYYLTVNYNYNITKEGSNIYDYESGTDLYLLDKKSGTASKVGGTDVNGDGTTDVNDVNAVVSAICGK